MFLANCQKINQIAYKFSVINYMNNSLRTSSRYYTINSTKNAVNLINSSLPNLTSTIEFSNIHRRHNVHFGCICRNYSSNHKENKDDDDDCELPGFDDAYENQPSPYLMVKNRLAIFLLRYFHDRTFDIKEFLNGAKQAITVVSNLLAAANFKAMHDMVDDDTVEKMRRIVGTLSVKQRQSLSINSKEIAWIFPHNIQFITQQDDDDDDDDDDETTRVFVEIMVVVHSVANHEACNIEFSDIFKGPSSDLLSHFQKFYSIANYRFIKEITKGVEDDWTINYICHAKPMQYELQKLGREQ
ncbi:uncharacterized protein LOC116352465 [Contarinia nasturtii]|uniref:uncharacterized protein LOC116352465 n=1 Tax=Contarinia nasturtii TaxID=265458 RepID=UPI0012D393EE|nr:uncharacterized protein LOC116352465 [Contarinia nasturtii]